MPKSPPFEYGIFHCVRKLANDQSTPGGLRLFSSLFTLLSLTSLRLGDARLVKDIWVSSTALFGLSINNKDKSGSLMNWAARFWDGLTPVRIGINPF